MLTRGTEGAITSAAGRKGRRLVLWLHVEIYSNL